MSKTLFISDIHGHCTEFRELLNAANYDKANDTLILFGDYVNHGAQSKDVIDSIIQLANESVVICIRGNHDDLFLQWLETGHSTTFYSKGGLETIRSYLGKHVEHADIEQARKKICREFSYHIEFLKSLPYSYENDTFICVHAGIDPFLEDWTLTPPSQLISIREPFLSMPLRVKKTVIFGHTPVKRIHESWNVWFGTNKIGIDGGITHGGQLNGLLWSGQTFSEFSI